MKTAVLFKDGFEELEALSVVDIFRRANQEIVMIGMDSEFVVSSHDICIKMDDTYCQDLFNYDVLVIPGGMPGSTNLQKDHRVIELVQRFNEQHKLIGAICAGPIVLQTAGVLKDKTVTCSPGFENQLTDAKYQEALVIKDDNIITGKGPAAALQFGYTLLEAIGEDSSSLQKGMQYEFLMRKS